MTTTSESVDRLRNEHGRKLIRRVLLNDDWASEVIFDVAAGDRLSWTPQDWDAIVADLEQCDQTVNNWLEANHGN